jgi:hypothetical protein
MTFETIAFADCLPERSRQILEVKAFCTSLKCVTRYVKGNLEKGIKTPKYIHRAGVLKEVKKAEIDCPDCSSVLIWRAMKEEVIDSSSSDW